MKKINLLATGLVPCINGCTLCDLFVLIKNVVDFLVKDIAVPLAVIIFIYGGIMMLTSAGSEEKIKKGKTALGQAIWGLIIVFAAWLIIDTIIKGFAAGGQGIIQGWGPWNQIPNCG